MTAMHMQLRTIPRDAYGRTAVTTLAGNTSNGAGTDDYFAIIVCVCERAMRYNRSYLDLFEAINRLDAGSGNMAPGRSADCLPLR